MRLFVRGIKGNIKLNPAIKLWGGLLLMSILILRALGYQFSRFREEMAKCEERGGVWIGGTPLGIDRLAGRRLHKDQCVLRKKKNGQW